MNKIINKLKCRLLTFRHSFSPLENEIRHPIIYRIDEIIQEKVDTYIIVVQVINKSVTFKSKPEDLLKDDHIVDGFSSRDIRALTYLGYLAVNSPKYRLLAQNLFEDDSQCLFTLVRKDNNTVIKKTAKEIFSDKKIMDNLNSKDSHIIGYTIGSESQRREEHEKKSAKNSSLDNIKKDCI